MTPDPGATEVVAGRSSSAREGRSAGFLSVGTVVTVVGALTATLLGGGLATRHNDILDGNTWIVAASRDGIERILRVNPGSGEVDLDTPSPLPKGRTAAVQQSNTTTAVVDATTGDTFAWDPVGGHWQKSTTRVSGDTALHLTTDSAFSVNRAEGTVRELEPGLLSDPVGSPLALGAAVSESVVDGSGQLWLALPAPKRVVAVRSSDHGPAIAREFKLPTSGSALSLTALKSGVMAADATGHATYRLLPDESAAERIAGVPSNSTAVTAQSSDDDTSAVLDPDDDTLSRVTVAGDKRAQSIRLDGSLAKHTFGRPIVFGGRMYVPDYTAGDVVRSTSSGTVETFPKQRLTQTRSRFDLFVDDGRLWVNARHGAQAFAVDRTGNWTPITKFEQKRIRPPKVAATQHPTRRTRTPDAPSSTGTSTPTATGHNPGRSATPNAGSSGTATASAPASPDPTASDSASPTPVETTPSQSPTPEPTTASPTASPTPVVPPGAPQGLAATPGDGSLTVNWQAPADRAGDITGYTLAWTGSDGSTGNTQQGADARQYPIPGLKNGVAYTVSVTALTGDSQSQPAQATGTPVTTATVQLSGAKASGRGQVTVSYTVDARDSGGVTCKITLNGAEKWTGGCAGAGSQVITGLANSTAYSVVIQATNAQGTTTSGATSVTTWAAPVVTITKGASAIGQGNPTCKDPSCAFVNVTIKNFTPGQSYNMTAVDTHGVQSPGDYPTHTVTAGADGTATVIGAPGKTFFFGFQNFQFYVTVDGIESNKITW